MDMEKEYEDTSMNVSPEINVGLISGMGASNISMRCAKVDR